MSFDIVLPKEGEVGAFGHTFVLADLLDMAAVFVEVGTEFVESAACLKDGGEVLGVAFQEELECCEVVEEATHTHDAVEFPVRQILVEHQEVVTEIEERLAGIPLMERCTA